MTDAGGDTPTSVAATALKGLCPRCGAATLFAGPIRFADRCKACGLDYAAFNVGDGPVALITLVVGAIVMIGLVTIQVSLEPPFWVQLLLWMPVTAALVVFALRLAKAALLCLEYRNAAREGRISDR